MARNAGIQITTSRFACLKIDDDDEGNTKEKAQVNSQSNNAKKKAKNKKSQKDAEQLKQLAFGGKSTGGKKGQQQQQQQQRRNNGTENNNAYDKWAEHDKELVEQQFKNDLTKALLQSKLEDEKKAQERKVQKERIEAGLEEPITREGRKKKKQKEKPQAMSLEQFKQLPQEKPHNTSDEESDEIPPPPQIQTRVPATQQDPRFFNGVKDDAEAILRQEKIQEEYRKHYASDNAVVSKLKNDLELKDLRIGQLTEKMTTMEAELKQVKKRNKQLCVILAQGEMKDKATVLLQVDELTNMRDELTEQVTSLTGELEKEKSKNHTMKAEMEKLKNNKHNK